MTLSKNADKSEKKRKTFCQPSGDPSISCHAKLLYHMHKYKSYFEEQANM